MNEVTNRPRVLHAVASGGFYGIERTLTTLLPELRGAGWPAELLCLNEPGTAGGEVGERCRQLGVPVHYLPLHRGIAAADVLRVLRKLRSLQPKLVHVHGYKATIFAGALSRLIGIPVVGTVHSEAASAPEIARHLRVEALILRRLTCVAAVSSGVATDAVRRGVHQRRVEIIRNGIPDLGRPTPPRDKATALIVVGRLVEPKNNHVALQALAALHRQGFQLRLVIAGDGPERATLEALARSLGIGRHVRFTGFVTDVTSLLTHDAIFVMPSRSEGIPIALLEAMAQGLPIVASRVGGIPDVVRHRHEALLVPSDNPEQLAAALIELISHPALALSLGSAARARFEADFQSTTMTGHYIRLYESVLTDT